MIRSARDRLGGALGAVLLSGAAVLGLTQAAAAQFAFAGDILPPRVVAWRLADHGYSELSRPRFDGRVYVVEAVSPTGVPVRLFVDPAVGAIVGRQRLGPQRIYPETYARLERPAPGFGWTEEDVGPRRLSRLPAEEPSVPAARPVRRPGADAARPVANPYGVNPDGGARPEAPKKLARVAPAARQPELKPPLRTAPEAPAPKVVPAESAGAAPKPGAPAAATETSPPADSAPAKPAPEGARAEAVKPPAQEPSTSSKEWKDPPAERRPVRVIGGATVVPGTADREPGAVQ